MFETLKKQKKGQTDRQTESQLWNLLNSKRKHVYVMMSVITKRKKVETQNDTEDHSQMNDLNNW